MRNTKIYTSLAFFVSLFAFLSFPTEAKAVVQSLNGQAGQNQTFQNDSNVTVSSSGDVHSLLWSGLLPLSRGGTGASIFTNGSILFINGGVFSQNNSNFFWDNTNNRLGIGTSSPAKALHVTSDALINSLSVGRGGGSGSTTTAIGVNALLNNTIGIHNTAVGNGALSSNTDQSGSTAVGSGALANTSGGEGQNTAVGSGALSAANMSGSRNGAFGQAALTQNTSGVDNTAMGSSSLSSNTTGNRNTAIGGTSLSSNTTGGENVAVGETAFLNNITGSLNTVLGYEAARWQDTGNNLTTANNSVYLGALTRGYDNSDSNSIVIGYNAIGAGANKTVIGNSSMTDVYFGSSSANSSIHARKLFLGSSSIPGCIIMGDSDGSGITYITANDGILSVSSTQPSMCQ